MSDFPTLTLREVLEKIADDGEREASINAGQGLNLPSFMWTNLLKSIAMNQTEPWAAQVAGDWLRENGYT